MRRTAGVRTEMVWGRKSEIRRVRARLAEVAAEIRDGLPRELLESLALRFCAARPDAPVEALEEFLAVKAGEWEEFRAQLAAVADSDPRFAPARAAEAAVKRADFDGADALLAGAEAGHEAGVTARRRAALRVARAGVLLLKGDADGAAAQVEAAAGLLQPDAPEEAAALRHVAAGRLYEEARLAAGTGHARAIGLLRRNEAIWTRDRPEDWVKTQLCLGITLADLGVETAGAAGAALLADAAAAFRATLEVFTRDARPSDWAMAQLSLGYALLARAERSEVVEEGPIAEALAAFAAGREVPRAALPEDWQRTQFEVGQRLLHGAQDTAAPVRTAMFAGAAAACRAALDGTRATDPVAWGAAQNNLGIALAGQAEGTDGPAGAALLAESAAASRAALEVFTRGEHAEAWAATQGKLGNTLAELAGRTEGTAHLGEAMTAYRAAMEVRTRREYPLEWAGTQANLGLVFEALGDRSASAPALSYRQAYACFDAALVVLGGDGTEWLADDVAQSAARVAEKLASAESGAQL